MNVAFDPAYFDRLYAADPDPWRFATSPYERAKYAVTLAALPAGRFSDAIEVGCSIGVLTRQLAAQCDRLLGVDVSEAPLALARRTCRDLPQVSFRQARIPSQWPDGRFDLVMLSEVLYFLGRGNIDPIAERLRRSLCAGGAVVLVNWLGDTGTDMSGDDAAQRMIAATRDFLRRRLHLRMPRFRLDVLARGEASAPGQDSTPLR